MDKDSSKGPAEQALFAGEAWFDPVETGVRVRIRGLIEELVEQELEAALGRGRYGRVGGTGGHRHGHRRRQLTGSFGPVELAVPRARLREADGGTREWRSAVLPRYARRTRQLEALIAGAHLAGTNTRRVQRALAALFRGAVGKDVVSRAWRKAKTDWDAWGRRGLAGGDVVRVGRSASNPGRHRRAGPAGPQGHLHLVAGGPRRAPGRAEGAAGGVQHGRGERGGVAGRAG